MGIVSDFVSDMVDTGKQAFNAASNFVPAVVDTLKDDAKDLVRVGKEFNPSAMIMNGLTNGAYRNLQNDIWRAVGVSDNFINEMDYRKHDTADNLRAAGNTLLNVGSLAIGGPGTLTAAKGALGLGKTAVHSAKAAKQVKTAVKSAARGSKDLVTPAKWTKTEPKIKSIAYKDKYVKTTYQPGEWVKTYDKNFNPVYTRAKGGEIKGFKTWQTPSKVTYTKAKPINPSAKAAFSDARDAVARAKRELKVARIGSVMPNLRKLSKGSPLAIPGIEDSVQAQKRRRR